MNKELENQESMMKDLNIMDFLRNSRIFKLITKEVFVTHLVKTGEVEPPHLECSSGLLKNINPFYLTIYMRNIEKGPRYIDKEIYMNRILDIKGTGSYKLETFTFSTLSHLFNKDSLDIDKANNYIIKLGNKP